MRRQQDRGAPAICTPDPEVLQGWGPSPGAGLLNGWCAFVEDGGRRMPARPARLRGHDAG